MEKDELVKCCLNCNYRIRVTFSDSTQVDYYCGFNSLYPKPENKVDGDYVCSNYRE